MNASFRAVASDPVSSFPWRSPTRRKSQRSHCQKYSLGLDRPWFTCMMQLAMWPSRSHVVSLSILSHLPLSAEVFYSSPHAALMANLLNRFRRIRPERFGPCIYLSFGGRFWFVFAFHNESASVPGLVVAEAPKALHRDWLFESVVHRSQHHRRTGNRVRKARWALDSESVSIYEIFNFVPSSHRPIPHEVAAFQADPSDRWGRVQHDRLSRKLG